MSASAEPAPRVRGLGHLGLYVRDLESMTRFYRDVMGLQITKRDPARGTVFFSSNPDVSDHEIVLVRGRPEAEEPRLLQQISWRLATLDDLRTFHRRLRADGYRIDRVLNHGSALGCYFFDPEGNRTEVFWLTGHAHWVPTLDPIDLEQPDSVIVGEVERVIERGRMVPMGGLEQAARSGQ